MTMVLIYWLNPTNDTIYYKTYGSIPLGYTIGFENGYGHYIIAIFVHHDNKFRSYKSLIDYFNNKRELPKRKLNILIDKTIDLLENLKRY